MEALLQTFGWITELPAGPVIAVLVLVVLTFGYLGAPFWLWSLLLLTALWGFGFSPVTLLVTAAILLLFLVKPIRRTLLSGPLMKLMEKLKFLPVISETEQTAIEAGTVWVDGELFSGRPDFKRVLNEPYPELTPEERAFLEGPVEELCAMVSDWEVFQNKGFSDQAWDFMREQRFFGLVIPEKYGGLGFSANAHSAVIAKLTSRSGALATTVMVPNSLGPAELLIHYGTEEQKERYLPNLAVGKEMPCFALTEPQAGSDAGAMQSTGEVFRRDDGEICLKLNWNKRYITLASISTVIGLAFKLKDPDNLLGSGESPGITCALIPSDTEGVVLGKRHDPLGVPFHNCPTRGHDVVVPASYIIGGPEGAGNGWKMLMESLAVGRGISLPAQTVGGGQMSARVVGAYAAIRKQFGLPIGKFEGIEEPIARIGGYTYLMEAARRFTCGGLDQGAKPAVVTAIAKYNMTELSRKIINDAMDVMGGAAISRGPRNLLAHGYMAIPIGITVEGANILTRTLIVFGQGAIRCHPWVYKEITALMNRDVRAFDHAFWNHIGHAIRNGFRSVLLSLTRGLLASSPVGGPAARYYRRLSWASATFALLADFALISYGGALKRKEKIAGRYADILSWMYLAMATLRRYESDDKQREDRDLFEWAMEHAFSEIQNGFDGLFREITIPGLTWLFRGPVSLWSRMNRIGRPPSDRLGHRVARAMQTPGSQRDRMTDRIYLPTARSEAAGRLEYTLNLILKAAPLYDKLKEGVKAGTLSRGALLPQLDRAVEAAVLSREEAQQVREAEEARTDAVQVDEFTLEEYKQIPGAPAGPS
ncbi:MAG: acyl-CoA dehydrogenase [Balneolaceae bacterium]